MQPQFLCTLGPASMNDRIIGRLEELGVTLFRLNLSHTALADLPDAINFIQSRTRVPLCLDSEGAQVRTANFVEGKVSFRENSVVRAHINAVPGDSKDFNLYPRYIVRNLELGDFISIDFNSVLVQVIAVFDDRVEMRVLSGGIVGSNKAVTVERPIALPPLTDKDRASIEIGLKAGLRHFALSFAGSGADVDEMRALVGRDSFIISKIESRAGLRNLAEIANHSDALLIDRGDLSREMPIERIPRLQKRIISEAKKAGRPVYVATNLLESMVESPEPTRAEVNDIYNTLADGADGLVLAAETAIGRYPIRSAAMVSRMVHEFVDASSNSDIFIDGSRASLLPAPHGGKLIQRVALETPVDEIDALPSLTVNNTDLMDCEQIAHGTYSPLTGFMTQATLRSVLAENRLDNGSIWTLPILLQVSKTAAKNVAVGNRVALQGSDGVRYAIMEIADIFSPDLEQIAKQWFGTADVSHPGVARLMAGGPVCLGGDITLVKALPSLYRHYQLTPSQIRFLFARKGWNRVVGFHTRNAVHRAHEYIQLEALERTKADGLFINPVVGPKKPNDLLASGVLASYQLMLDFGMYPKDRVLLAAFSTYSRYSGPREAVFTALCRKNMGCSHFIVGRDHTGVGNFYAPEANRRLFDSLGDIEITPVFFNAVGYNPATQRYQEEANGIDLQKISGTQVRDALRGGAPLPDWFMRDLIQEMFRSDLAANRPIFHEAAKA